MGVILERLNQIKLDFLSEQQPNNPAIPAAEPPSAPDPNAITTQPPVNPNTEIPQDPSNVNPQLDPMTGMSQDPNMLGIPPAAGMFPAPEIKTSSELGRIYELNKLYTRLYTVHSLLRNTSDPKLINVKQLVGETFDIFKLILNNIPSYKDKIDDVILTYYDFISNLVITLDKYYKEKSVKEREASIPFP